MMNKMIKETSATGQQEVDMALTDYITAVNEQTRHSGLALA